MALLSLWMLVVCKIITVVNSNRDEALRIMENAPVIDGHNDLPWQLLSKFNNQLTKADLFTLNDTHTNIPKLREGRVGGQFWAAFVPCDTQGKDAVRRTLEQIDVIHRMCEHYPDVFLCVDSAEGCHQLLQNYNSQHVHTAKRRLGEVIMASELDGEEKGRELIRSEKTSPWIAEAFRTKRVASLIGVEGGHSIDSSLGVLRTFYNLGVRYMTLTHSCNVPWVDNWLVDTGSHAPKSNGLSEFGKSVILEMNRLGMIIDLSHVSAKTMKDTLEVSQAPVIFSHSSAYQLCRNARNVQDDVLRIVKEKKGLVMVNFYNDYVTCNRVANLSNVADHFDYIKRIAGYESVGFGGDYDGVPRVPEGLEDVSKYPDLVAELLSRGWTQTELEAALANNLLRVFKEVEQTKFRMSSLKPKDEPIDYKEIKSDCHTSYGYPNNTAANAHVGKGLLLLMCFLCIMFL